MVLHIEDNEKFELSGTGSNSTSSMAGSSTNESLDQLILKGVFRSFNPNIPNEILPARVSIKDRRELAVKLGFCLMNFFDTDFASKRISFRDRLPYLTFDSDIPVPTNVENFRMGHPALLSFAKLLLELDFGQSIEIDISPDLKGNEQAWCQLMGRIEHLEQERSDSYVEAIRGCFMVPYMISKALRSRHNKRKDVDSIIRKHLYKEIVYKLKLGYDQSNFVSTRKRQRPDSPSRSSHRDGNQASKFTKLAMRSLEPERTIPEYKKRRIPEPQTSSSLSGLIHRENGSLCNNKDSADNIADSYVSIILSNNILPFAVHQFGSKYEVMFFLFKSGTKFSFSQHVAPISLSGGVQLHFYNTDARLRKSTTYQDKKELEPIIL